MYVSNLKMDCAAYIFSMRNYGACNFDVLTITVIKYKIDGGDKYYDVIIHFQR